MTPRATLRLQFHGDFTFADATRHIDRYAALGVSHIYASPLATARAGSMHGYDVVDPTRIAPALGGEESLRTFAAALRDAGLGLILDIVPNHMAADLGNGWWRDVLQWGRASRYAAWFDIDWNAPGTNGKVLLPVLGGPLDETVARKPPKLGRDGEGRPALLLGGQTWPLAEGTERNAQDLRGLLAQQHYLLVPWRVAGDRLNWRRFFDINELVCLRMEEPEAFEAVHVLPLRLFAEGIVDGLRVDHVDGLTDPAGYCRTLRGRLDAIATQRRRSRAWLVVEKILFDGEALPTEWRVDGTTGYDFMNDVSALQHDPDSAAGLGEAWARLSGRPADFAPEEQAARREIVARSFSAQLDACAASFERLLDAAVPRPTLRRLLTDILVHMPAYRTYGSKGVLSATDRVLLGRVGKAVKRTCLATDRWAAAPLIAAMQTPPASTPKLPLWDKAMARLQQLSAPIAAKAVEDTGFYRYGRLLSRNDVGFDTALLGLEPVAFHGRVAARQAALPHAMVTTATHDHKRGEDLRARLATLSECAPEWTQLQSRWIAACEPLCRPVRGRLAPSAGDIAMLLQMLVGGWPIDLAPADKAGRARLGTATPSTVILSSQQTAQYTAAAAEIYRALIQPVPGSGPVLGVAAMTFAGVDNVYAFRANVGGTAVNIWKASGAGWVPIPLLNLVSFSGGGTATPLDGQTLIQGGVTATIRRVMTRSGAWTGTAAGGFVVTNPVGGSFVAGAATTSGGATVTLAGAQTAITLLPGGHFQWAKANFGGQSTTRRLYGCDGVNKAFEFDGTTLAPITTGLPNDAPSNIVAHKGYLFISFGSSVMYSGAGTPFRWSAVDGGGEVAVGDVVTGMITLPGSQTTATLAVYQAANTSMLYGNDPSSWNLVNFNTSSGARPYSLQNLFDSFSFDNLGPVNLQTTLSFGNFASGALAQNILPFILRQRTKVAASTVNRGKGQYRVFFNDGYGLYLTVSNQQYLGAIPQLFPNPVYCCDEAVTSNGAEVAYFGSSDGQGYVYQLDSGPSFDGRNLDAYIVLAWDALKAPRLRKRFRAASLEVASGTYVALSFGYQLGYGTPAISQPVAVTYPTNFMSAPVWDQFVWDQFVWDGQTLTPTDVDMVGTAENVQVTLASSTNYIGAYALNSLIYHYTPRRGLRV